VIIVEVAVGLCLVTWDANRIGTVRCLNALQREFIENWEAKATARPWPPAPKTIPRASVARIRVENRANEGPGVRSSPEQTLRARGTARFGAPQEEAPSPFADRVAGLSWSTVRTSISRARCF